MGSTARKPDRATKKPRVCWLVDPIDGTKAFVREYPMFSTQNLLMRRGENRARRVERSPCTVNLLCRARLGAYLNGKPAA